MINRHGSVAGGRPVRDNNGGRDRQELNCLVEAVGDHCGTKVGDCIRIVSQNINGLGQSATSLKDQRLKNFAIDKEVNVLGIQEFNVCWNKVKNTNKVWDRFRGWKESCNISVAFNTFEKNAVRYQPGGTGIVSIDKMSHVWDTSGFDDKNLGRWAWTRYRGSMGRFMRVISMYRPVVNTDYNSAYMQQLRYSLQHRGGVCPRELLFLDLGEEIQK